MAEETFGFLLSDTARMLRRRFDSAARAHGVSRAQWRVLFALSRHEGINQAGLADYLEVETITLCRMIDRLQEAGLVERRADPADRRAWRLFLTPAALPLFDTLKHIGENVVAEALAGISEPAKASLLEALQAIRGNLARPPERRVAAAE